MIIIFVRTAIIFLVLTVVMRLMGKRQIGEMQPFEFIITLIIADLACIPMADVSIPLVYGVASILALFILHQVFFLIESSGSVAKKIISGRPSIVINKDGVNVKELKKNALDVEDLTETLRSQGYFSFDEVDYAIFEANGKLSVLENKNAKKTTSLPYLVVSEGKIKKENLAKIKIDGNVLSKLTKNCGLKKVEILTLDETGKAYLKIKNEPFKVFNLNGKGENL